MYYNIDRPSECGKKVFNIFDKDAKMIGVINKGKVLWFDEVN